MGEARHHPTLLIVALGPSEPDHDNDGSGIGRTIAADHEPMGSEWIPRMPRYPYRDICCSRLTPSENRIFGGIGYREGRYPFSMAVGLIQSVKSIQTS
jgi:hypothetical protein